MPGLLQVGKPPLSASVTWLAFCRKIQALVHCPQILLLDDPTSSLDFHHQLEVLDIVRALTLERKMTTLIALHDLSLAGRYADRVAVLHNGTTYYDGKPARVLTEIMLRDLYHVEAKVMNNELGAPLVVPLRSLVSRSAFGEHMTTVERAKEILRRHWSERATDYNRKPRHGILSENQYLAWKLLIDRVIGASPKDVLDVGSGTGFVALIAAQLGHRVTGVDFSAEMITVARGKAADLGVVVDFMEGDAEAPPVPDVSMDVVVLRHLFWMLPNPDHAISAWANALRPGGRLILFESAEKGKKKDQPEFDAIREELPYVGGIDSETLGGLLIAAGLTVVLSEPTIDRPGTLLPPHLRIVRDGNGWRVSGRMVVSFHVYPHQVNPT